MSGVGETLRFVLASEPVRSGATGRNTETPEFLAPADGTGSVASGEPSCRTFGERGGSAKTSSVIGGKRWSSPRRRAGQACGAKPGKRIRQSATRVESSRGAESLTGGGCATVGVASIDASKTLSIVAPSNMFARRAETLTSASEFRFQPIQSVVCGVGADAVRRVSSQIVGLTRGRTRFLSGSPRPK